LSQKTLLYLLPGSLLADVALITSLRDGMNLVSYEYVACQADNAGVLVLSEFAGAAQSLGAGAHVLHPKRHPQMLTRGANIQTQTSKHTHDMMSACTRQDVLLCLGMLPFHSHLQ
jgi:trehalose-6-phosphate synthase